MPQSEPEFLPPDFQRLFAALPGMFLVLDPQLRIVAASDAYLGQAIARRAELVGRKLFEVLAQAGDQPAPAVIPPTRASLARVLQAQLADSQMHERRQVDAASGESELRYWSEVNSPVLNADATLAYIIHRLEDVTHFKPLAVAEMRARVGGILEERERSKAFRRESDAQLAAALQRLDAHLCNSPLAIIEFDPEMRVTRWSKEAESLFGWSAAEIVGRTSEQLRWVHAEDAPAVHRNAIEMLTGERPRNLCRQRNYCRNGTLIHCEWYNSALYRRDGRLASVLSQVLDVSERDRAQAALVAARDEAEHANRAKSVFLANMSHEIRTPLNVIIGLGHLMSRDCADPGQRHRLEQLCANSTHLLALVNDVLDLTKIEADRLVLDATPFRLGTVIDRVRDVLARPAADKGLQVAAAVAPELGDLALCGDALRLTQILINLGSNAVKFTDRGSVRLEVLRLAEDATQVVLRFAVEDTGIGIAAADQARLFEVFTQGDGSPPRAHGGSGLGLAISQRLTVLMGGIISVESRLGESSRFSFELTLPRAASAPAAPPALVPADLRGLRVLFAEDHLLSQEILFEMLEDIGCDVDVASDGSEAIDCARARRYDLILLDMDMPVVDGLAAARAIRALPDYRDTPIVALSANAFAEDRQRCLDAGMNGHIGKPVTPVSLAAALGQWLPNLNVALSETPLCDNELSRALSNIAQLDVGHCWQRSPEVLGEYRAQLERFMQAHGQEMARIEQHLAAGEHAAARVAAHNLKGVAGLLGAMRVAALAGEIEQALRAQAEDALILALASECAAQLSGLGEAIRNLPPR